MKYKLQLSEYGTVAYRGEAIVEANSEEEAIRIAEEMAKIGEIEFTDSECVDGWQYQVETVEEEK